MNYRQSITTATRALDLSAKSMFGGELVKAKFVTHAGTPDNLLGGATSEINFLLNPASIHMEKSVGFTEEPHTQTNSTKKYSHTDAICLDIGELWFDTYDTRESVRTKYIDDLEALCDYDGDTHYPRVIVFHWGQWSESTRHKNVYTFFMSKLTVDYSMFLADGTPVRAKVGVCLTQVLPPNVLEQQNPKQSPDHARIYTIKQGDSLQAIARMAYGDPREWRRVANANMHVIDDPMLLRAGKTLVLPPILK